MLHQKINLKIQKNWFSFIKVKYNYTFKVIKRKAKLWKN